MCLENLSEVKKAEKDICCYKVIEDHRNLTKSQYQGKLITIYRCFEIEIGKTYTSRFSYNSDGDVEKGLHSYCSYEQAVDYANKWGWDATRIVKCVIPKGSKYYRGKFNSRSSYASTRLKYVEITDYCRI